ncbi:PREDICTED: cyclin-dependent kinase inhibitor 1C [Theobroma cacao]|uniref:Cyclin-dependent kinase inhibitor 1C n=1 Tax=Theobroma cacao TaxID=3641 RepID=A0AB32WY09_THECC|nr:PREDICTED: cyclin-dependent kinase inhibitor 1C [Theobroma cacao]
MGGCATKPKVLKGDEGEVPAPVPPPEPTKEPIPAVPEAKEAADVVAQGEKKVEDDHANEAVNAKGVGEAENVADDDKVDDQANKRRSLSNLFKENEKKGSAESDDSPSEVAEQVSPELVQQESVEPVKQEPVEPVKQESVEPVQTESVEPVELESVEPVKQASSETEKLKEASVAMDLETAKPVNPVEETSSPESVVAPGKIETEQSIEAAPATEPAAAAHVS